MGSLLTILKASKLWQVGVIAFVVLGGSAVAFAMANGGNEARLGPNQQLVPVQYGNLVNQVSINGSLIYPNKAALTFGVQGTVGEVLVQTGEYVEAGQPVARLESLTILTLERAVAQAQINVRKAEQALATAVADRTAKTKEAQTKYDSAAAAYRAVFNKWLGVNLAEDEMRKSPSDLLAAWDVDLTGLFSQGRFAGLSQAWLGVIPPNDPATRWNETVVYTWLNLAPGAIMPTCTSDATIPDGASCILREMENAWTPLESAQRDLDAARADADLAVFEVMLQEADLTLSKSSLAEAEARLTGATLRAPIAGLVTAVNVSAGDSVTATTTIAQIIDPSVIEVNGVVDEIDVLSLRVGSQALVTLDALGNRALQGTISTIASEATTQQGVVTYPVRVRVSIPQGLELREGLSAVARVVLNSEQDVLMVPLQAVYGTFAQPVVRVANGSRIEERPVVLGNNDDFWVAVREGLSEGESVVMEGGQVTAGTVPGNVRFQGGQGSQVFTIPGSGGASGVQQLTPEQREQFLQQFQQGGSPGGGGGFGGGGTGGRGPGGGN